MEGPEEDKDIPSPKKPRVDEQTGVWQTVYYS